MDFNLAEQMAVLKSVDTIMRSDDRVYEGEARFLTQLAAVLQFDLNLLKQARDLDHEKAYTTLKAMPESKKYALGVMLQEAASSDGRVSDRELQLIANIFERVGIETERL
ncbi:TerB family tellurite resistance protein [Robiginitalea sp. M366]|uniref:TerB family tellurite resistance protein n=1 Tax=Robiginitalea aestuariiviva TaxID=3036903 RepID=UPI00240DC0DE|nr:TerB family tellurite resistance protein [Robiginitalea aestuariiviva]MDG1571166.1 TerB family tellurite resistance protein [Robiginitalea aestuariiviva]